MHSSSLVMYQVDDWSFHKEHCNQGYNIDVVRIVDNVSRHQARAEMLDEKNKGVIVEIIMSESILWLLSYLRHLH